MQPPQPRFALIVLAAGAARRLGRDKALLPWHGRTLLEHVLAQFRTPEIAENVVVANPSNAAALGAVLGHDPIAGAQDCGDAGGLRGNKPLSTGRAGGGRAVLAINDLPGGDMLSSIRCGLSAVPDGIDAILVHPVDSFGASPPLVDALLMAFARGLAGGGKFFVPVAAGRRGHPLLFSCACRAAIMQWPAGSGLNALLRARSAQVVEVPWSDERILRDIDTPEDYARAIAGAG